MVIRRGPCEEELRPPVNSRGTELPWKGAAMEEAPPALSEPSDDAVLAASVSQEILSQNIPDP